MTTGLREVAHGKIRRSRPPLPQGLRGGGQDRAYRAVLRRDATSLHPRSSTNSNCPSRLDAFGPAHVYLFMGWVRDRGVSAGTQHRRQREVKAFFSWCRRMGYCRGEPLHAGADGAAGAEGHPALLRKRTSPPSSGPATRATYVGSRMKAMVFFLLDTGGPLQRAGLDTPR